MKFARQLAAVLLLVGAIVALGLAWGHASGAGRDGFVFYGRQGSGPGFSLSNSGDLIRTVEIEILIMAVVITISAVRLRRRRRHRRAHPLETPIPRGLRSAIVAAARELPVR